MFEAFQQLKLNNIVPIKKFHEQSAIFHSHDETCREKVSALRFMPVLSAVRVSRISDLHISRQCKA